MPQPTAQQPQTPSPSQSASKPTNATPKTFEPPRSDSININDLPPETGESSSKDTQIDLSPPDDDSKLHPRSSEALQDAEEESGAGTDVGEFHPWDPHKAAKDVEVGDFYFKLKNYRAAESRYREALFYKNNDATATFRLAVCLDKMQRSSDAIAEYQSYLRILPYGPEAKKAHEAIDRIQAEAGHAGRANPQNPADEGNRTP